MNVAVIGRDALDIGELDLVQTDPMREDLPAGLVPRPNRWGIVLAGGEGTRLRTLVKLICGEERPKQFCPLFDGRTLLAQTLRRAELTIPRTQLLISVAKHHRHWYRQEVGFSTDQLIVQPTNRGTAPAVLHSVLSISRIDENAVVAILPSDHHYSNESRFAAALESAFIGAEECSNAIVLLGARADYPETEYGWIELGESVRQQDDLFEVHTFREKPSFENAQKLWLNRDSVWNTFVMVGRIKAFLEMFYAALPELTCELADSTLWKGSETHIEHSLYKKIPSIDLSKEVLSAQTKRLLVLRLGDVGWCDLGGPERVLAMFPPGSAPTWISEWRRANGAEVLV